MPKLLLSVRNAQEARLALEAGVDLVDVKEPSQGPLGAASPETIREILQLVNRRALTSVAYGELLQWECDGGMDQYADPAAREVSPSPGYVKLGLSGCRSIANWQEKWKRLLDILAVAASPVAVVYADWDRADSPPPAEVVEQARKLKRATVLIDTFDKRGPGLLRLCSIRSVQSFIDDVHAADMAVAVAGQLTLDDALAIAPLTPDYLGVRGAVCRPDRNGQIDLQALAAWRCAIAGTGQKATTS